MFNSDNGMMMEKVDEFAVEPENKMKHLGEPSSPTSSKRKRSLDLPLMKEEEGESHLECPAETKGNDATDIHDVHEEKPENEETSSIPPQLENMAGDGIPPKTQPDDLTCPKEDGISTNPGPGTAAQIGGTIDSNLSVDDPKGTVLSTLENMPSTWQISAPQKGNDYIKCQLMKEVRKFGRKYERIFTLLEDVQGPPEVKKQFVEFTIKEATRFKRWHLIKHLEMFLEKTGF
ncbi:integrator complex subunit 6-like isoform X2 [Dasypus novemcinctus]|uniref:integrator complex subunit 6-like isoform X2 n=1 Tax=Dasypus novemcinctus TaxID=9361 RepID=UPI00062A527E|nr:integrator complex subunit 6-like isoform X2 [Dasypus novemcinctus]